MTKVVLLKTIYVVMPSSKRSKTLEGTVAYFSGRETENSGI